MKTILNMLLVGVFAPVTFGAVVTGPSLEWVSLGEGYDFLADQQTGVPAGDIVGQEENYGFFTAFNENEAGGELGFRVRLDAAGGNKNNPEFDRVLWIGMDADGDGSLDLFLGVNHQGSTRELTIRTAGTGLNTSPSTTSVANTSLFSYAETASNYDYRPVNYLIDGGTTNDVSASGTPDYYVSFFLPFNDVQTSLNSLGIEVTSVSPVRYVAATSTQANSLNQDLGGVDGGVSSAVEWEVLGGFSPTITPTGILIPEPGAVLLGLVGMLILLRRRYR